MDAPGTENTTSISIIESASVYKDGGAELVNALAGASGGPC